MKFFNTTLFISLLFVTMSCSTIMNGSKSEVKVTSNPTDAIVFVNNMELGPTPAILRLQRGETHLIEIKKPGYKDYRITTSREITGWFWGNIICGGLVGGAIDLITGNAYDVEPKYINVNLNKDTALNEFYDLENFNGINLTDDNGNNLGEIKIVWE